MSKTCHAPQGAINTIQAVRRSVVEIQAKRGVVSAQATQSRSVWHAAIHTTLRVEDTLPDRRFLAITV